MQQWVGVADDMPAIMFSVAGTPRGQPRARHVPGHRRPVSTMDPKARLWREAVKRAASEACRAHGFPDWLSGAVDLDLVFTFATRHAERWGRPHTHKPDKDNLEKLALDAASEAGLLPAGDQRVASGRTSKVWGRQGGVVATLRPHSPPGEADGGSEGAAARVAPAWLSEGIQRAGKEKPRLEGGVR